jgi:hypothetical protein
MKKIEDLVKEFWSNETIRDAIIISGVTGVEYVAENIITRQISPKYHNLVRAIADLGSNGASYYIGKSQGEKSDATQAQNGPSGQN